MVVRRNRVNSTRDEALPHVSRGAWFGSAVNLAEILGRKEPSEPSSARLVGVLLARPAHGERPSASCPVARVICPSHVPPVSAECRPRSARATPFADEPPMTEDDDTTAKAYAAQHAHRVADERARELAQDAAKDLARKQARGALAALPGW